MSTSISSRIAEPIAPLVKSTVQGCFVGSPRPADRIRTALICSGPIECEQLRAFFAHIPTIDIVGDAMSGPEAVPMIVRHVPQLLVISLRAQKLRALRQLGAKGIDPVVAISKESGGASPEVLASGTLTVRDITGRELWLGDSDRGKNGLAGARLSAVLSQLVGRKRDPKVAVPARDQSKADHSRGSILVRQGKKWISLEEDSVDCVMRVKSVVFHVGTRCIASTDSFKSVARRLDRRIFIRIGRSAVVNVNAIRELHYDAGHCPTIILNSGVMISARGSLFELQKLTAIMYSMMRSKQSSSGR
jgi:two-component system, LytTR family, response regulator